MLNPQRWKEIFRIVEENISDIRKINASEVTVILERMTLQLNLRVLFKRYYYEVENRVYSATRYVCPAFLNCVLFLIVFPWMFNE